VAFSLSSSIHRCNSSYSFPVLCLLLFKWTSSGGLSVTSFLCLDCIGEISFYLCGFWGDTDKLRLSVFNLNPLPVFTRTRYFIMAQIIPLLGGDSTIPLLGGVGSGFLGREISVNISRITDLPTPKSPPKRGLSNLSNFDRAHRIFPVPFPAICCHP